MPESESKPEQKLYLECTTVTPTNSYLKDCTSIERITSPKPFHVTCYDYTFVPGQGKVAYEVLRMGSVWNGMGSVWDDGEYILTDFERFRVRKSLVHTVINRLNGKLASTLFYPSAYHNCLIDFDENNSGRFFVRGWDVLDENNNDKPYFAK